MCLIFLFESYKEAKYLIVSLISIAATIELVEAIAGIIFPEIYLTLNSFYKLILKTWDLKLQAEVTNLMWIGSSFSNDKESSLLFWSAK